MNHVLFGTLLVIALNARECNQENNANGEVKTSDQVEQPTQGSTDPVGTTDTKMVQDTSNVIGRKWYILTMNEAPLALPEGAERPWLEMQGGQLQGFGGCNNLMGSYVLQNDRLSFTEVGSTKKYCPDLQATERSILDMLAQVNSFQMAGDSLQFLQGMQILASLKVAD